MFCFLFIATTMANSVEVLRMEDLLRKKTNFHKPGENYKADGYVTTSNTTKLLEKHLKETGGKVSHLYNSYRYILFEGRN